MIDSVFYFDQSITIQDRILLYTFAEKTNSEQMTLVTMRAMGFPFTRKEKVYGKNEPVIGSIYTERRRPVKMSFTLWNPERLIEFF
ncbi:MAG: hypothetical protein LKK12_01600 [Bacteroidales bacterium]|nr:hypothetical protein [Bacteroidales bacterium]MCI2133057.1 hypothetical protein [Bacteroidales bacterium]